MRRHRIPAAIDAAGETCHRGYALAEDPRRSKNSSARLESTAELLVRVRGGDSGALDRLVRIYTPVMERWAHGRLPAGARGVSETQDLVQITLVRVLNQIGSFEARRPGAFLAYLRRSLLNNLRNEIRSASRRPSGELLDADTVADPGPSPLERVIGRKALEGYEAALERLSDEQKAAVIMRIELGCGNREIAELLGSPSANAARMVVSRALARLARLIDRDALEDGP